MGELAGARQSGGVPLRYANFATDLPLLEAARRAAGEVIARDPALARPEHAAYRERIVTRYERGFELFRVGGSECGMRNAECKGEYRAARRLHLHSAFDTSHSALER